MLTISGSGVLVGGTDVELQLAGAAVEEVASASENAIVVIAASNGSASTGTISYTLTSGAAIESDSSVTWPYLTPSVIDALEIGDLTVSDIELANDTVLVGIRGRGTARTVDVIATGSTRAQVTETDAVACLAIGVIDSITSTSGQQGSQVTIAGERMLGGRGSLASLTLAGVSVDIDTVASLSDTSSVVIAALSTSAITGDVEIVSASGAVVSLADAWQHVEPGDMTLVKPSTGQRGAQIVIEGCNHLSSGSSAALVTRAGIPAIVASSSNNVVNISANSADENACSGHGDCGTGAHCTCKEGWAGDDRPINTLLPPDVRVASDLVFDVTGMNSAEISVSGTNFLNSPSLSCRWANGTTARTFATNGTYVGLRAIICRIPTFQHIGAVSLNLPLIMSNDCTIRSAADRLFHFLFYDAICQRCNERGECGIDSETCTVGTGDDAQFFLAHMGATGDDANPCKRCQPAVSNIQLAFSYGNWLCRSQFTETICQHEIFGSALAIDVMLPVDAAANGLVNEDPEGYPVQYRHIAGSVRDVNSQAAGVPEEPPSAAERRIGTVTVGDDPCSTLATLAATNASLRVGAVVSCTGTSPLQCEATIFLQQSCLCGVANHVCLPLTDPPSQPRTDIQAGTATANPAEVSGAGNTGPGGGGKKKGSSTTNVLGVVTVGLGLLVAIGAACCWRVNQKKTCQELKAPPELRAALPPPTRLIGSGIAVVLLLLLPAGALGQTPTDFHLSESGVLQRDRMAAHVAGIIPVFTTGHTEIVPGFDLRNETVLADLFVNVRPVAHGADLIAFSVVSDYAVGDRRFGIRAGNSLGDALFLSLSTGTMSLKMDNPGRHNVSLIARTGAGPDAGPEEYPAPIVVLSWDVQVEEPGAFGLRQGGTEGCGQGYVDELQGRIIEVLRERAPRNDRHDVDTTVVFPGINTTRCDFSNIFDNAATNDFGKPQISFGVVIDELDTATQAQGNSLIDSASVRFVRLR